MSQSVAAVGNQFGRQLVARLQAWLQLHHRLHRLAPFAIGNADGADITDSRVLQEDGVHFGWVDVHTTRDDQVGRAVSEVEIPVLVEVPDVTKGEVLYTSPSPRDRTRSRMPSSA